ncbi:MAG: hypothetical protein RLZZ393_673 [Pseudomonadota bacterium]
MSEALKVKASRRRFLAGVGIAGAAGAAAAGPATVMLGAPEAAGAATVILHDSRIPLPADVAARLQANGAQVITLGDDPVRLWRTEVGAVLRKPDTRLFGVTRWSDYLIVRGLAAESRRHARHEQHHPESGHFTWLIA